LPAELVVIPEAQSPRHLGVEPVHLQPQMSFVSQQPSVNPKTNLSICMISCSEYVDEENIKHFF
jgi:hypothetical protein